MKKIWGWIIGVVLIVAIGFSVIWDNLTPVSAPAPTDANTNTNASTGSDQSASGTTSGTAMGGMTMGNYKDGTYTGPVADAVYGKLQLVVTVNGGMITNITWPVYPNDPGHTSDVSASALPQLEQEAIASQSANVNAVSGATQDSTAFQQSLAAALAQAKS